MKKIIMLFLLLLSVSLKSQIVFDTIIGNNNESDFVMDLLEDSNNNFVLVGMRGEYQNSNSFIIKLSQEGEIIEELSIKTPKTISFKKIIDIGTEYLIFGTSGENTENKMSIYSYDYNLSLNWNKEYHLFERDTIIGWFIDCIINKNNEIVVIGSAGLDPFNDDNPFACKFSLTGDSLFFKYYDLPQGYQFVYDIDTLPNTSGYLVAGYEFRTPSNFLECNIVTLNNDLIIDSVFRPRPENPYDMFWGNSQIEFITDTSFLSVSRKAISNQKNRQEEEVCVQLYDTAFNLYKEVSWGAEAESMDYFSFWGLDFINKNNIYVGGTSPIDFYFHTINNMMLTKLDENLDIVWTKFYGNNASYRLDHVVATKDGGCLMVGKYLYPDTMNYEDVIIIKVDENGNTSFVSGLNDKCHIIAKDIIVYPNPSNGVINFQKGQQIKNTIIEIYDITGKFITKKEFIDNQLSIDLTRHKTGTYFYNIINKNKIIDSGQFVLID